MEGNLFLLWGRNNFKLTLTNQWTSTTDLGYIHCQELPWRNKHHCKTWHHRPGRRNPWILHGARGKNILVSWHRRFQPFNLEWMVWVIEKFRKGIWIQPRKIHQKQTFFHGTKSLLASVIGAVFSGNWTVSHTFPLSLCWYRNKGKCFLLFFDVICLKCLYQKSLLQLFLNC